MTKSSPTKITLLTCAGKDYAELLKLTSANKAEYCKRWDLALDVRSHFGDWNTERAIYALEALKKSDWLWFMGADTLITNFTIDVRQFLDSAYDFIIGEDVNGINNDSYFIQNTPEGRLFLQTVIRNNPNFKNDQDCMNAYMSQFKTKVVHQKLFNAFDYKQYNYPSDKGGQWEVGDFVLHLPAVKNSRRIDIFNSVLPKVVR